MAPWLGFFFPLSFFFLLFSLFPLAITRGVSSSSSSFSSFICRFKPVASISPGQGSCFYARSDIPRFMHTNIAISPDVVASMTNESSGEVTREASSFLSCGVLAASMGKRVWCALHFLDVTHVWEDSKKEMSVNGCIYNW
jgi:hypothetical protein